MKKTLMIVLALILALSCFAVSLAEDLPGRPGSDSTGPESGGWRDYAAELEGTPVSEENQGAE